MNHVIIILVVCVLAIGIVDNSYAHKAEIIGDYKIEVGWESEPPIAGQPNHIEIIVTVATEFDKESSDHDEEVEHDESIEHEEMTHEEHKEEMEMVEDEEHLESGTGVTGLSDKLEAVISLDGKKVELILVEQPKAGVYHAEYTPSKVGSPSVNLVGEIGHSEFEITFHPEKVENLSVLRPLQQIKANIAPSDVQCKEGLELILSPSDRPACVSESSALKLISLGWIQ